MKDFISYCSLQFIKLIISAVGNGSPDVEVRLLGRIVVRYMAIELGKADTIPYFYRDRTSKRTIMEIWSHAEDMRNDARAWRKFESIYARLVQFYGEKSLCDKETVFQLHCRNYINRHAISNRAYLKVEYFIAIITIRLYSFLNYC